VKLIGIPEADFQVVRIAQAHQVAHRAHLFIDRDGRVYPMGLMNVDGVQELGAVIGA